MSSPQCCDNPPTLSSTSGSGRVEEVGGVKSYVSGSIDSNAAVVLVSDVYGYEAPNLRKLGDKVAAAGFYVVIPDLLYGDPYSTGQDIFSWLPSHSPDKGAEDTKPIISHLKSKGISAIGAAGFCWGAKVVAQLAKTDDIKAVVMLHPSLISLDDIKEVKVPISVLGAEIDQMSPPELVRQFKDVVKPEVDLHVKIFDGCVHGWTVRYDVEDATAVKRAEEAHQDMLDWFNKYVK
ncbi:hypothetical protein Syun_029055 [Stephania yunnanensis]|uniref:Dienelactone hydrolase domain-containing protein n=1 Tax=Stephania yunnanensis TaxID=152371 RepID=A0AAP0E4Y5_9MAGN